jgi:hypothetical protein
MPRGELPVTAAARPEPGGAAREGWGRLGAVNIDPHLWDDLQWRGLVAHSTDPDALRAALTEGSVRYYVGFDPTAPSLHMGSLVQILTAKRLQLAGHTPYVLVGGATGMIGDPKESGERTLNNLDTVKGWVEKVRAQIEPYLSFEGANAATMVNNYDWTATSSAISASTSPSTGCWPATSCGPGSRPGSATPSSATCCCSRWTSSTCSATTG